MPAKTEKQRNLTTPRIIAKAMALADRDGLEALSMRAIATKLGVTAMSLYNHVANKDALIDLMVAEVVGQIESPEINAPWEPMLRRRAKSLRQVILRHPWAAIPMVSRINLDDTVLRDIDATVGCLVSNGFSYAQADWARNAIDNHVYGFTLQELNFPVQPEAYRAAATEALSAIPQQTYPFMHQGALEIIEGRYDGLLSFDFGLDLILDGLTRWKGGPAHPAQDPDAPS